MQKKIKLSAVDAVNEMDGNQSTQLPSLATALISVSANYNERLAVFNLMEQLNHLCRGVQRHRGFSMGLLAGNKSFLNDFNLLQEQMNRRIQLISAFSNRPPLLLSHTDLERLHYAWSTIRDNWQDDSVLENFELHSHFVDQLLVMMAGLIEEVRLPYAKKMREIIDSSNKLDELDEDSLYQKLLYFAHRKLPHFIEMLGKVRALSVNAAATGFCENDYGKRLQYLLQCIGRDRGELFELCKFLQVNMADQLPSLLTIRTYEYKLNFLLEKIDTEILNKKIIDAKEEDIFNLVTDIIDIYWRVVDDSLNLLHDWQREDLEQWLIEG